MTSYVQIVFSISFQNADSTVACEKNRHLLFLFSLLSSACIFEIFLQKCACKKSHKEHRLKICLQHECTSDGRKPMK